MVSQVRPESHAIPIRWRIFSFLFAIGFLEYLQQRGLTVAAERMMPTLHLSQMQIGWLEQAFVIGYALFQVPGGVLGQRWGARWTFTGIGALSVITIAVTCAAPEVFRNGAILFYVLFTMQLLLGIWQAPTFPVSTGVFERWFLPRNWALVQGLQTMGLGLGGALAPFMVAALMTTMGWQIALFCTALPGIPLLLFWAWYGRNTPEEHSSTSKQELALIGARESSQPTDRTAPRDLRKIILNRRVLLLTLAYFSMNYVYYLLGNWCFLYLVQAHHFSVLDSGKLAIAPPIAAGIGAAIGGVVASRLYARFGSSTGLRIVPVASLCAAAALLLAAVYSTDAYVAITELTLCYGAVELTEGSFWAAAMTIGRRDTMTVGGMLNMGGCLGGVVGIPIVAYLSGRGAWNTVFLIGAATALASAIVWLFVEADDKEDQVDRMAADPALAEA
jgi:MFS transporter, ACS family, glucarate transporter